MSKNQIPQLRIKLKELADEIRHNKKEEQKAKGKRKKDKNGKVIPGEFVGRDDALRMSVRYHRLYSFKNHERNDLRTVVRHILLAYAFLRGVDYARVEKTKKPITWKRVHYEVQRFGGPEGEKFEMSVETVKEWVAGKPSPFARPKEAVTS